MRKATTGPASKRRTRTKTTPFDVAAYLRTTEDIAAYLDAWLTEAPDDAARRCVRSEGPTPGLFQCPGCPPGPVRPKD